VVCDRPGMESSDLHPVMQRLAAHAVLDPGTRSHPGSLPMVKGRAGTMTHDYKRPWPDHPVRRARRAHRKGDRPVPTPAPPRHRHEQLLIFLKTMAAEIPKPLQVHLTRDNYDTYKHPDTTKWLARHQQFHLHSPRRPQAGSIRSNAGPRPHRTQPAPRDLLQRPRLDHQHRHLPRGPQRRQALRLDATAEDILAKVQRARSMLCQLKLRRTTRSLVPGYSSQSANCSAEDPLADLCQSVVAKMAFRSACGAS
jgi:hypothetical protein